MASKLVDALKTGWNIFTGKEIRPYTYQIGPSYSSGMNSLQSVTSVQSVINSLYNRIAIDVSQLKFEQAYVDEYDSFQSIINNTGLSRCLMVEANADQSAKSFIENVVLSLFEYGDVAVVPTVTDNFPNSQAFDIQEMRVGHILEYHPNDIIVEIFNPLKGVLQQMTLPKAYCAIIQNPMLNVMNAPNSTLKRLVNKINMLDNRDKQANNGKLDLVINLPYTVRGDARQREVAQHIKNVDDQLSNSTHGIVWLDQTEKVTQLNRPVDDNLSPQIKDLKADLYHELGIPDDVFSGVATPQVLNNYYSRTVYPVAQAICDAMNRSFISKTAYTQGQRVVCQKDPFSMIPIDSMANVFDTMSRNAIMSSNELRSKVGLPPDSNPDSYALRNKNLNSPTNQQPTDGGTYNEQTNGV